MVGVVIDGLAQAGVVAVAHHVELAALLRAVGGEGGGDADFFEEEVDDLPVDGVVFDDEAKKVELQYVKANAPVLIESHSKGNVASTSWSMRLSPAHASLSAPTSALAAPTPMKRTRPDFSIGPTLAMLPRAHCTSPVATAANSWGISL